MSAKARLNQAILAFLLILSMSGCVPAGQSELDEERESHFLAGKRAINTLDYSGAIEEFEKAIEANPRNSKAHQQLGWLYEEKESDPAAAIYHYEKYLKLRPDSDNAEVIRQRIVNCKQDLAKTVLPLPITPGMQRQIEQLVEENKRLKEENERWKNHFAALSRAATNQLATGTITGARNPSTGVVTVPVTSYRSSPATNGAGVGASTVRTWTPPATGPRTHVVQPGETAVAIARRYNVSLTSFLAANPSLEPKRMRIGQTVVIPSGRSQR